jgi:hypothetical protein
MGNTNYKIHFCDDCTNKIKLYETCFYKEEISNNTVGMLPQYFTLNITNSSYYNSSENEHIEMKLKELKLYKSIKIISKAYKEYIYKKKRDLNSKIISNKIQNTKSNTIKEINDQNLNKFKIPNQINKKKKVEKLQKQNNSNLNVKFIINTKHINSSEYSTKINSPI